MNIAVVGGGEDNKIKEAIRACLEQKGPKVFIVDTLPPDYIEPLKYKLEAPPEIPGLIVKDLSMPNQPSARAARRKAERHAKKKKRRF